MKFTLGFSPCPNDTFIFDALVHKKIDTKGLEFEVKMADVEELNQTAMDEKTDITKLSFHALAHLAQKYVLLNSGSALGFNCGPLLIAKKEDIPITENTTVAIPGNLTTANFLLSLAYPKLYKKKEMLFSEIENAVIKGEVDAGLIIHENRFTYQQKGLKKIIDLGEWWQEHTTCPIPLGGIVMHRKFDTKLQKIVSDLIAQSVRYAFNNPESSVSYVKQNAQEMEESVVRQHISLYVNEYSLDLGAEGRNAVNLLFEKALKSGVIKKNWSTLFVD